MNHYTPKIYTFKYTYTHRCTNTNLHEFQPIIWHFRSNCIHFIVLTHLNRCFPLRQWCCDPYSWHVWRSRKEWTQRKKWVLFIVMIIVMYLMFDENQHSSVCVQAWKAGRVDWSSQTEHTSVSPPSSTPGLPYFILCVDNVRKSASVCVSPALSEVCACVSSLPHLQCLTSTKRSMAFRNSRGRSKQARSKEPVTSKKAAKKDTNTLYKMWLKIISNQTVIHLQ